MTDGQLLGGASGARCFGTGDPLLARYHDEEWGLPVLDERGLFERISLEAVQSGLSWRTILAKREAFRAAFAGFDPDAVARFGDADVTRLLADADIVRNRAKIEATLANARATLALRASGEPLDRLARSRTRAQRGPGHVGGRASEEARDRRPRTRAQAPRLSLRRPDHALRADAGLRSSR
jgi:DNA-3-methyladenine glycosylase I